MNVLVTAACEHGATGEIAAAIADALRRHGLDVVVMPQTMLTASSNMTRSYLAAPSIPATG
jgi:menaquinone-dependent protoporphyrinogen IX oxidase